eukprot:2334940-Amphidinium_carterae.1
MDQAKHVQRGLLLSDALDKPPSLQSWEGAPVYTPHEFWSCLSFGTHEKCWLTVNNSWHRCEGHLPRTSFSEEEPWLHSEALRCCFGFKDHHLSSCAQPWLAMGRRARSKAHGVKSVMTLWTSIDAWSALEQALQSTFEDVQHLWIQTDENLQGLPNSIVKSP